MKLKKHLAWHFRIEFQYLLLYFVKFRIQIATFTFESKFNRLHFLICRISPQSWTFQPALIEDCSWHPVTFPCVSLFYLQTIWFESAHSQCTAAFFLHFQKLLSTFAHFLWYHLLVTVAFFKIAGWAACYWLIFPHIAAFLTCFYQASYPVLLFYFCAVGFLAIQGLVFLLKKDYLDRFSPAAIHNFRFLCPLNLFHLALPLVLLISSQFMLYFAPVFSGLLEEIFLRSMQILLLYWINLL